MGSHLLTLTKHTPIIFTMDDTSLSSEQIRRYKAAFTKFDTDKDGVITGKELGKILRHIGQNPTEAEVQEMVEEADKDGTGTLDIIEFLQMMREKVKEQNKEDEIKEAFTVFDVDGNGYIDRRELALMMRFIGEPVSQEEIDDILDEADKDQNGLIDYTEFADMMAPGR